MQFIQTIHYVNNAPDLLSDDKKTDMVITVVQDLVTRSAIPAISKNTDIDVVPICELTLPHHLIQITSSPVQSHIDVDIASVAVNALPGPDETAAWQDIIDFRTEQHDKLWNLRRFLHALATKRQTPAEISDEIEWMVNEYSKAMKLHHIKASQSFVDVFVISPLEIIEDLVKFNRSKIAKGALSVQKRKVELMEAEVKAPGRECAYVFDARKRFGG